MSNILILTLVFRPDNVSTAQIMGDLAIDLQNLGHKLFIITTVPHYNRDDEALSKQPIRPYFWKIIQKSNYCGMEVLHIIMPRKSISKILRIASWLGFHVLSTTAGILCKFKPEIIIAPSPPLTIGVSAWLLAMVHGCKFIYNVQEIYPDVAKNLGMLRNKLILNALRGLERFVYSKAGALSVISDGMGRNIRLKGVSEEKVRIIPNFVDVDEFSPLPKENEFSKRFGLNGKFVVSYIGNMGQPQGLSSLIEAAHLLRNENGILFLLIGDGSERISLIEYAKKMALSNVLFIPYQPYSMMPQAYAVSDASFVSQAIGTSNDGIPSKVYRIMACARPVIACTDNGSDLENLVRGSDSGIVVPHGDAKLLSDAVLYAFQNQEAWMKKGAKARNTILEKYSRRRVIDSYDQLIKEIVIKHG